MCCQGDVQVCTDVLVLLVLSSEGSGVQLESQRLSGLDVQGTSVCVF